MDQIYANSYTITSSDTEVFLKFRTMVPQYDRDGKYVENKAEKEVTVVLPHGGLEALRKLLNKKKEDE